MGAETYTESVREIPVIAEYDVVVCGGGPSGCAAALSAARGGVKTLVVEKDGYLGGATVSQLVVVILSSNGVDFQGVWHEFAARMKEKQAVRGLYRTHANFNGSFDPEMVKFTWDELLDGAGAQLLHHAYAPTAIVEEGRATGVVVETRAGRQAIRARLVIDATGDGIVCAQAGAPWDQGDGTHKYAMSHTKVLRVGGVYDDEKPTAEMVQTFTENLEKAVQRGEYTAPVVTEMKRLIGYYRGAAWRLPERRPERMMVISRILKTDPLDPWQLTRAEREGRDQAFQAVDALVKNAPGFEKAYLLDTSNQLGVRSSRRIHGLCTVTDEDALENHKYPDGIARGSWNIDVWPADSYERKTVPYRDERTDILNTGEYYDIRYGCIVAKTIDNLLMAGRCISASHMAESSLRIQQTCMSLGQAAGTAAAFCLKNNTTPRELDPMLVVDQLKKDRDAMEPAFEILKDIPIAEGA